MTGYYKEKLSALRLQQVYEIAAPRGGTRRVHPQKSLTGHLPAHLLVRRRIPHEIVPGI
jgi:hypothetical protein